MCYSTRLPDCQLVHIVDLALPGTSDRRSCLRHGNILIPTAESSPQEKSSLEPISKMPQLEVLQRTDMQANCPPGECTADVLPGIQPRR